jgi:hypothetical protein
MKTLSYYNPKNVEKRRRKHLDAIRAKGIQMSRATALQKKLRTHMIHHWNLYIQDDGAKVVCCDQVTVLNRMRKELGLKQKVHGRHVNASAGRREMWGYLDFNVNRDFNRVPKRRLPT